MLSKCEQKLEGECVLMYKRMLSHVQKKKIVPEWDETVLITFMRS